MRSGGFPRRTACRSSRVVAGWIIGTSPVWIGALAERAFNGTWHFAVLLAWMALMVAGIAAVCGLIQLGHRIATGKWIDW